VSLLSVSLSTLSLNHLEQWLHDMMLLREAVEQASQTPAETATVGSY
jgi:hypothetical protein